MPRFVFGLLLSFVVSWAPGLALGVEKIALVSVQKEAYDALELVDEAAAAGARLLLFPEWGFYPQDDLPETTLNLWRQRAVEKGLHIALGLRHEGRNAVAFLRPEGAVVFGYRRDGHNSPQFPGMRPLVVDTSLGRIGVLFCDESRNRTYLDEMKSQGVNKILAVNWVGQYVSAEQLARMGGSLGYFVDVFTTDIASPYGNRTHVYRANGGGVEFNAFGLPSEVSSQEGYRVLPNGLKYVISYHDF